MNRAVGILASPPGPSPTDTGTRTARPPPPLRRTLGHQIAPKDREVLVLDIAFVVGTAVLFAVLGLLGRALEKL